MGRKGFILLVSLMLFSVVQVIAQTKRALIIGIGQQEDKDYQSNYELAGKCVGKLTYALCQLMKDGGNLTNKEVEAQLKMFMLRNPGRNPQTPVISGETENNIIYDVLGVGVKPHNLIP